MTFADPQDWPANRRLWTEALRDPSREQVTGRLGHPYGLFREVPE